MKSPLTCLLSICLVAVSPLASAAKQLTTIGHWTIYQHQDTMTDEKSCVALFSGPGGGIRGDIALTSHSLIFDRSKRGGVWDYQLRFDDAVAAPEQGLDDDSRIKGIVFVQGSDYEQLASTKRLRARFSNVAGEIRAEDLDISGVDRALEFMSGPQCK